MVAASEFHRLPELRSHWDAVFDLLAAGRSGAALSPLLDVGSGDGDALRAVTQGTGVWGIAVDHAASANWHGPAEFSCVRADAASLPFRDRTFGAVLHMETLEWLPNVPSALREAARVAAGPLIVVHSDWNSLWFDSGDPDTSQEFTRLFAGTGTADNAGSWLATIVAAAGLTVRRNETHTVSGERLAPDTYAAHLLHLLHVWLVVQRAIIRAARFDRWQRDLAERAERGEFAFSLTRHVVVLDGG